LKTRSVVIVVMMGTLVKRVAIVVAIGTAQRREVSTANRHYTVKGATKTV
jgi:hypothetical protein